MRAMDVMTRDVVSVGADLGVRQVARTLLEHSISAVPVLDSTGQMIGMVSEGDLVARDEDARLARRDWWLTLVAEPPAQDGALIASLRTPDRVARDVMSAPVVSVGQQTELDEIARLLIQYRIKRVPVVEDGHLVGIVSRADLIRGLLAQGSGHEPVAHKPGFLDTLLADMIHDRPSSVPHSLAELTGSTPPSPSPEEAALSAKTFRASERAFHDSASHLHDEARRIAAEARRKKAAELSGAHVSDEAWAQWLAHARAAAEAGAREFLLFSFPAELCTDGGRAINVMEADWINTLRGEPAEIALRWERELKPAGFALSARVLEFPDGLPGNIGMFLDWGE